MAPRKSAKSVKLATPATAPQEPVTASMPEMVPDITAPQDNAPATPATAPQEPVTASMPDIGPTVPVEYVPLHTKAEDIVDAFRLAMGQTKTQVSDVEERGLSRLLRPIADYYAMRLKDTGKYPDEKQTRKFFSEVLGSDDYQTSRNVMAGLVGLAVKCGALIAQVQRTSVFLAWYRVVGSKLEFQVTADKPAGEGWRYDVLHNKAVTRPHVNNGTAKNPIWNPQNSAILPMSHKDISDSYNAHVVGKAVNPDGTIKATKKGPDNANNHGSGNNAASSAHSKVVTLAGADDLDIVYAMRTLLKDKERRDILGMTEKGNDAFVEVLELLDACLNSDGEFVPHKHNSNDSMLVKAA